VIGVLRHRITIESPVATQDEGGGRSITWSPLATVWAQIEQTGGRQLVRAGEVEPQTLYRLTLRHVAGIIAGMRAVWGAKLIEITGVTDPDGRGRTLVLEGVNRSEVS
jgi:SPP1 family predicted phage head-tail adaptor